MIHARKEREDLERATLAPYAARSAASLGRRHPEPAHDYRPEFQRDRDRVIYSQSFRRLEYKTQVFINGTADHYRTRLTHTIEMAAVGRTVARALRAHEDLTEAIALAHDIGHSPFGHAGERELNELMRDHGGFDHNVQSLRWVEKLERRYPDFPGLNLTWEVRAGLRKHEAARIGAVLDGHPIGPQPGLEAQIADVADDISYHAHDAEDGLEAGLVSLDALRTTELWRRAEERSLNQTPGMAGEVLARASVRAVLDLQVRDVIRASEERLDRQAPRTPADVMAGPERIVAFSAEMLAMLQPYRRFLSENVYWHPAVAEANRESVRLMRLLFLFYVEHPDRMGGKARARLEEDGLWRTACDYVSGMTDRYALEECRRFGLG